MVVTRSLVFGNIGGEVTKLSPSQKSAQEYVRDVILVHPSLDPYAAIQRASQLVSSGESLYLDATERTRSQRTLKG